MNTFQRVVTRLIGMNANKQPATPLASNLIATPAPIPVDTGWIEDDSDAATKATNYSANSMSSLWLSGTDISERPFTYADNAIGWMMAARFNVWCANCIKARANVMAAAPIRLYKKSSDVENVDPEIVNDHPVLKLLERVNPKEGSKTFYKRGARQMAIHGEWYILKVRKLNGEPTELHRLPAQWTYPHVSIDMTHIDYYQYQGQVMYAPEDIVRVFYPREDYPVYAASPTQTALFAANGYNMADLEAQYRDRRGGQGGGIISVDGAGAKDWSRIKAEWDSQRSDIRNSGRDAFLPPGATYASGVLSAQEQQREQRSTRLAKEIMAAYSVPPSLAGDYSDASVLANAAQQSTNFWQSWALPELDEVAEALNVQLLWPDWPDSREAGLYLAFDTNEIKALQPDRLIEVQVDEARSRIAGQRVTDALSTINEAREYINLDEYPDERADILFAVLKAEATQPAQTDPNAADPMAGVQAGSMDDPTQMMPGKKPPVVVMPTKALALDIVGLQAVAKAGGAVLGHVEKVHRFGIHERLKATKHEPVLIIAGKAFACNDVVLQIDEVKQDDPTSEAN